MNIKYNAGIDIGSTTVKLVLLDNENNLIYGEYKRHNANTKEAVRALLERAKEQTGECELKISVTGSGSINLGKALDISFVQEVSAVAKALKTFYPKTEVAIELGGEDAKIIYFKDGLDERMNGVCAGGTGSFIDQMAALLQTDAEGLNKFAQDYKQIYTIAARCGVFAKTDIQPLINEGATKEDLAASIFQAVVNQTISGLACGKPIRGCVAFLGGPLHFMPELKKAFIRTLNLIDENTVDPENSHLFAAMGAAMSDDGVLISISKLIEKLNTDINIKAEMPRLPALFESEAEYNEFIQRHEKAVVKKSDIKNYSGNCFLGIDAGSTTTKVALVSDSGELLYSFYANNEGKPIETAKKAMAALQKILPQSAKIVRSCSTGYGENLLKSAFNLEDGEVETIAHTTAAEFFENKVDCVLDIGGQDMKCIRLKDRVIDSVMLNEACSSGCGSFIENFANSLGYTAEEFSQEALLSKSPVDLGTRCTVFMNSNVKQAQKEGVSVSDIASGLAYSVIKNALYKVIKLSDAKELGSHIVVQGGTFHNKAVLRALEIILDTDVICPDISGIMGAFGAALIAKQNYHGQTPSMLSLNEICALEYTATSHRCGGCQNNCMLTFNRFSSGKTHITGNRCEKGIGGAVKKQKAPNIYEYKKKRIFGYEPLSEDMAIRGVIGIPRVLNMYENYPFWATFFKELGFRVVLSPFSNREIYEIGMETIPSESECYPAKLSHGHIEWLISKGVKTIFHPCVFYEKQEIKNAGNHFNCPMVISYAENLKNNVEALNENNIRYIRPFIAFTNEKIASKRLIDICKKEWDIPKDKVISAVHKAWIEQGKAKNDILTKGKEMLKEMEETHSKGIVLAGRPYHIDPEINHGIPELIASFGLYVFSEDSLPINQDTERKLRVVDQWVYHSRLYSAAEYVCKRNDLELIQLNSFGCGLDAVTSDQVQEILSASNKLYTLLKIDEISNLGAVRIRIRSLISAMKMREHEEININSVPFQYKVEEFTSYMQAMNYTILAPQMSPIHFDILEPVFKKHGYNLVILDNDNRSAIDTGLKFVNNDACFPSITVVGQIMEAVLSGKYNTDRLAILMTQTGGACRASNYVAFIRRALKKAGYKHIPVISLNANGMEKNSGFKLTFSLLKDAALAVIYGDLLMRCLYRTRPYEHIPCSANELHTKWKKIAIDSLVNPKSKYKYKAVCEGIVKAFDELQLDENIKTPKVGIVGEILVKYMPLANNHLVELLEKEGAEAVVPDFADFFNYCFYGGQYKHKYLGAKKSADVISKVLIKFVTALRKPAINALEKSKRFSAPIAIERIAEMTKPVLSLGNQYGEGWFLAGEMIELLESGVNNIICIQPFGCLPNHVVGKGVIKELKNMFPGANIAAVDYDAGASEVNQLNRIKLMLTAAKEEYNYESDKREIKKEEKVYAEVL